MINDDPRLLLARRLRALRTDQWPGMKITQPQLARALGAGKPLSVPLISSWESLLNPRIPPMLRIDAYAALFATPRSFTGAEPCQIPPQDMSDEERQAMESLRLELRQLRKDALIAMDQDRGYTFPNTAQRETDNAEGDQPGLLFRVYVPTGRLYAAEAERLLSLFRDWMSNVRGRGFRQASHQTKAGTVYEFFSNQDSFGLSLREEFSEFSGFLALCASDPSAASEQLLRSGISRAESSDIVLRYGREVRRVAIDMSYERNRRVLAIRHSLESELVDRAVGSDFELGQIGSLVETLVPDASPSAALPSLEGVSPAVAAPLIININPQIINAVQSHIQQNVQGMANLGPQAKDIIRLIGRYGGEETAALETAVYEVEDPDCQLSGRRAAKRRLMQFLTRLGASAQDIAVDLLAKYLETKAGI